MNVRVDGGASSSLDPGEGLRPVRVPLHERDELEALIAEQERDAASYRVWSQSLDALPSGADLALRPRMRAHDDRHGSVSFYVSHRCRCGKCRAASAEYQRERRGRDEALRERENAARAARRREIRVVSA